MENKEKTRRGKAIPVPKKRKLTIFSKKVTVDKVLTKRAAINNGLQGITIAPKKKPNMKELKRGFLVIGILTLGINSPKSILNIKRRLIMVSIPKAIGETTPITFDKET